MIGTRFDRRLDRALDSLLAGRSVADAAGLNWSAASLEELLRPAVALREQMPLLAPEPVRRHRSRTRFASEMERRRVDWIHHRRLRVEHHVRRKQPRAGSIGGTLLLLVALLLAVVAGAVLAIAAQFSERNWVTYPLKRLSEDAMLATARGTARADLQVTFARQRLRESGSAASNDQPRTAVEANRERYRQLLSAGRILLATSRHDAAWTRTRDRLEAEESIPATVIERALAAGHHQAEADIVRRDAEEFAARRAEIDRQLLPPEEAKPKPPQ